MRSALLVGLLLLVPAVAVTAASPEQSTVTQEVPMQQENGIFAVPVRINSAITLKFVLDSGAADVQIPDDVFSTLIRADTITKNDIMGVKQYKIADGTSREQPVFNIRELQIGDTILHDVAASVSPPTSSLLLGQSFLKQLDSWTLDNRHHVFKFSVNSNTKSKDDQTEKPEYGGAVASYQEGTSDWKKLYLWFSNLSGFNRAGADYWAANRHVPNHISCANAASQAAADETLISNFRSGCDDAKKLLEPMDERRSDVNYRAGFNDAAKLLPLITAGSRDGVKTIVLCGHPVAYELGGRPTDFSGAWSGFWNITGRLCGGLIVQKVSDNGEIDLIYVYGPSHPGSRLAWKQQHYKGYLRNDVLWFRDDQGSVFKFFHSRSDRLSAAFTSRSGGLTGSFAKLP